MFENLTGQRKNKIIVCRDRRPRLSARNIFSNLDLSGSKLMFYKGNPHLCVPLFRPWRNSPLVALANDRGVSPSAEGDQGAAFGNRKPFGKGLT